MIKEREKYKTTISQWCLAFTY